MNVLNSALVAFGVALTILVFAFGVRRLLGLRLAPVRTLLAGLIAFFSAQPIVSAIGGPSVGSGAPVLPGLWFVLLGVVIALLVGMIFLVVSEALVPSGSLPGPVYLARALRRQAGRTRRYAQTELARLQDDAPQVPWPVSPAVTSTSCSGSPSGCSAAPAGAGPPDRALPLSR
jgi:ubiquinone biosynthesis protein